jgi:hypothetical protein
MNGARRVAAMILALAGLGACKGVNPGPQPQAAAPATASTGPVEFTPADFAGEARAYIADADGDVAQRTGLVFVETACLEPASTEVGSTYVCRGQTSDGQLYDFLVTIVGERTFQVDAGNLAPATNPGATTMAPAAPTTAAPATTLPPATTAP